MPPKTRSCSACVARCARFLGRPVVDERVVEIEEVERLHAVSSDSHRVPGRLDLEERLERGDPFGLPRVEPVGGGHDLRPRDAPDAVGRLLLDEPREGRRRRSRRRSRRRRGASRERGRARLFFPETTLTTPAGKSLVPMTSPRRSDRDRRPLRRDRDRRVPGDGRRPRRARRAGGAPALSGTTIPTTPVGSGVEKSKYGRRDGVHGAEDGGDLVGPARRSGRGGRRRRDTSRVAAARDAPVERTSAATNSARRSSSISAAR